MTKQEIDKLRREILEMCRPMMEGLVNELKSSTFYDAALQADRYNNTDLGNRFRAAGDEALAREQHTEFENTLDVYREFDVAGFDFVIAHYIPGDFDVLICLKDVSKAYMVRIDENTDSLKEINSLEFKTDIATLYQRKPVAKPNVPSIGSIIYKDRATAKELAGIINNELGTNLSWRWFYADKKAKTSSIDKLSKYQAQSGTTIDGYNVGIVKRNSNQATYSIFYVIIGNEKSSFVMTIYKALQGLFVFGNSQPGPIYNVIKIAKPDWPIARPSKELSHIQNIFEFFSNPDNRRLSRLTFNFIAKMIDVRIDLTDIETGVRMEKAGAKTGQWASLNMLIDDDADLPPVEDLKQLKKDTENDEDMSDFGDF